MRFLTLLTLPLLACVTLTEASTSDPTSCVSVDRVRSFSLDTDSSSFVVREGERTYRRVTVEDDCPLATAEQVGLGAGTGPTFLWGQGSAPLPVTQKESSGERICAQTPHAYAVLRTGETMTTCRITSITAAHKAELLAPTLLVPALLLHGTGERARPISP